MENKETAPKDTHEARIKQCAGDPPHYLIAYISYGEPDDCPLCKTLKPLPTLEELERVVDKVKLEGMLHILPDDRKKLATAILDLLKGER